MTAPIIERALKMLIQNLQDSITEARNHGLEPDAKTILDLAEAIEALSKLV